MARATPALAAAVCAVMLCGSLVQASPTRTPTTAPDARSIGPDLNEGRSLPLDLGPMERDSKATTTARAPELGDTKNWLGFDEVSGLLYLKRYKLRGEGRRIEVWVARDRDITSTRLEFPHGDCRNDKRVTITDKQIRYLIREFDDNIFPKESAAFSRPPRRNGTRAVLPGLLDEPRNYYVGHGKRVVVLIDNVRDENFYDTDNSKNASYISGFFSSQYNELLDRNVLTLDAFDWRHRLRGNPPHNPVPGDPCDSKPARPYLYEGVLAHEYQHLLEYYRDSAEATWVNEGLSDWAQTVTGYVNARLPITNVDFDSHVQAFYGWLGVQTPTNPNPRASGPENSLTWWKDQGDEESLADYGAAYTFMLYLADQFGDDLLKALHRDEGRGLDGVQGLLAGVAPGLQVEDVVHRWVAMVALDAVLDDGAVLAGGDEQTYTTDRLDAIINWDSTDAYSAPGAPPNGADYVRLRDAAGTYLNASAIETIEFDGAENHSPEPVQWIVDDDPPGHAGDPALHSGSGDELDRAIVRQVTVPADAPTLTFETLYDIDEGFDGAFVQVSTDGGATYESLANEHTTSDFPPGGSPTGREAPGLTGSSGGWIEMTFDLSAYAGTDVLLAFRYITDGALPRAGWWIDDVSVGGVLLSEGNDLSAWRTPSEIRPERVFGFTVQLVAYDDAHSGAWIHELELDDSFDGVLSGDALRAAIGDSAQTVAALVTYDEPNELVERYAPYTLTVDGTEQPGG